MSEPENSQEPSEVSDSWQQMVQAVLAIVLLIGAVAMFHYYAPVMAQGAPPDELQKQVTQLTQHVEQLEREQAMPALVLNRYRNSIGYIYGIYQVGFRQPTGDDSGARVWYRISRGRRTVCYKPARGRTLVWR